ncbi:hypothetical protein OIO90_004066 [Microbotryomycetes sp. JL221]|nr:hypothetical protein OIO90_004066 [Microbotryomycetes sp. JL221]
MSSNEGDDEARVLRQLEQEGLLEADTGKSKLARMQAQKAQMFAIDPTLLILPRDATGRSATEADRANDDIAHFNASPGYLKRASHTSGSSSAVGRSFTGVDHATEALGSMPGIVARPDAAEGDGTGSLTVDEGSGGYLGSLSGAALLHFLQHAADINLKGKTSATKSVASPASTANSFAAVTPDQAARFIDAYFKVFQILYPVVHEATFRAQVADVVPRPGGAAWNLLYLVILGIGSMCVLGDATEQEATLAYYDRAARSVSTASFESPSLTGVQAFILLANFAQKLNHTAAGGVFLGIALRMAINQGLHTESASRHLPPFEQEIRRRIWWTLFVFDSGSQLTFGHPSTLPTQGVDVLCIVNANDATFTPLTKTRPVGSTLPTSNSSLIYQTFFHQVASSIVQTLTSNTRGPLSAIDALQLCHDLDVLEGTLPAFYHHRDPTWFSFARNQFFWRTQNLRMLVLRSVFLKVALAGGSEGLHADEERAWQKCLTCAIQVVRSIQQFTEERDRCLMEWWYCCHFIFPPIFILLIALRVRPAHTAASRDWLETVQRAASTIERVHHPLLKGLAQRCLTIITAVANVPEAATSGPAPQIETSTQAEFGLVDNSAGNPPLDADFASFLEMLAGSGEFDTSQAQPDASGHQALVVQNSLSGHVAHPHLRKVSNFDAINGNTTMGDLDALLSWFTPT